MAQHGLDPLRILRLPQHVPAPSLEQVRHLPTQPGSCSDVTQRANRRGCAPPELCRCHPQLLAPAHQAWGPHSWGTHTFQQQDENQTSATLSARTSATTCHDILGNCLAASMVARRAWPHSARNSSMQPAGRINKNATRK